jgi:hypothetical protein
MKTHDPELEEFKRTIDLVEYAKKTGYEPRPNDGALGLTVLDHPNGDRVVVAASRPSRRSRGCATPSTGRRTRDRWWSSCSSATGRLAGAKSRSIA